MVTRFTLGSPTQKYKGPAWTDGRDMMLRNMFSNYVSPPPRSLYTPRWKSSPTVDCEAHWRKDGLLAGLYHRDLDLNRVCHCSNRGVSMGSRLSLLQRIEVAKQVPHRSGSNKVCRSAWCQVLHSAGCARIFKRSFCFILRQ